MTPSTPTLNVLLETSFLRGTAFADPDFRKLAQHCKDRNIRIFIPHIVWEEYRTQFIDDATKKIGALASAIRALQGPWMHGLQVDPLIPQVVEDAKDYNLEAKSRECMAKFVTENNIEIIPIAADHGERAWARYFRADIPFDAQEKRTDRRKDIPDSWIFETAIDLLREHAHLTALCRDGRLAGALNKVGIQVFTSLDAVLGTIESTIAPIVSHSSIPNPQATPLERVEAALAGAHANSSQLEQTALGYIGYLGNPTKDELFTVLDRAGFNKELARNTLERLTIEGFIKDTGNHYLPLDKELCREASGLVETEIINLLDK